MTAKLSRRTPVALFARAAFLEQVAAALKSLTGRVVSDSSIHSARKSIKKARATLRLIRHALPEGTFRKENRALRDAAHPLNAARDAKVLVSALDRLAEKDGAIETTAIATFRRALIGSRKLARRDAMKATTGIRLSRRLLRAAHRRAERWRVGDAGWPVLSKGLQRVYSRGRRGFAVARSKRSSEHLHEWRKEVKYLWHQLQLLQPIRRGPIGKLAAHAHRLSDLLGHDHDLAVLREQVLANKAAYDSGNGSDALIAAIDRTREELEARALALGARVYEETAGRFAKRFSRYWQNWEDRP